MIVQDDIWFVCDGLSIRKSGNYKNKKGIQREEVVSASLQREE